MVEAVRHLRKIRAQIRRLPTLDGDELFAEAKTLGAPVDLVREVAALRRLPVPSFAAGGIATPADAALCMALGAQAVFVGSGIFLSEDPAARARAIVGAAAHWREPKKLAELSRGLGEAMPGLELTAIAEQDRYAHRGW